MSDDPLIRRLSRFTPDASGLDRDALLFAAGRASARPNRAWITLVGALAVSQVALLSVFLWPRHESRIAIPVREAPVLVIADPEPPSVPDAPALWSLRAQIVAGDLTFPRETAIDLGPEEEPLRAFGPMPPELLN